MMEPSLDLLMKKSESKYALVVLAAKRARQLMAGEERLVNCRTEKPVSIALKEIAAGLVHADRSEPDSTK